MSSSNLVIDVKPLEEDENVTEADGSSSNPSYSARLLHALVLRVEHINNVYESFVVTISPKNEVLSNPCKELDNILLNSVSHYPLKILFYPEISKGFRYHYHGIVFCIKGETPSFHIWVKSITRKLGNTFVQKFFVLEPEKSYKAYNPKVKREQETDTKRVIDYITKNVNHEVLLSYLNADIKFNNLEKSKGYKQRKVSTVISNLNKYDMLNLVVK